MKCKRRKAAFGIDDALIIASLVAAGAQTGTSIVSSKQAASQQFLSNRNDKLSQAYNNMSRFAKNTQSFYNNQDAINERNNSLTLPTLNNSQFKCGGKRYYNRYAKSKFGCKRK